MQALFKKLGRERVAPRLRSVENAISAVYQLFDSQNREYPQLMVFKTQHFFVWFFKSFTRKMRQYEQELKEEHEKDG